MSFLTTSIGFGVAAEEDAVWEDACALAGTSERANDVEEVGIVALAGGRRAEGFEALIGVVGQVDAVGPALIAEGRIGSALNVGCFSIGTYIDPKGFTGVVGRRTFSVIYQRQFVSQTYSA
jgi:hypothetical protein